jgi:hypothetical protein
MVQQHIQAGDYSTLITATGVQTVAPTFRRRRFVPPNRDGAARTTRIGRPGSKRYQRFLNKEYLSEQQWDLELEDFQVVRFGCTPFTRLFEEHNNKIWEPFIDITEEEEQWMLRQLEEGKPSDLETRDELGDWIVIDQQEENLLDEFVDQIVPGSVSMRRVQKDIRKFIRKNPDYPFLVAMDKEITSYIETEVKCLSYKLETAFQRMICHGICQYYSLQSRSEDQPDGTRLTIISKPRKGVPLPSHTLSEYLQTFPVNC